MNQTQYELRILPGIQRGDPICVTVNGEEIETYEGETILAVLLTSGYRSVRHTEKYHESRGVYCGMGICYDCLVTVNGEANVRACVTPVEDGMHIDTGEKRNGG